MDPRGCPTRSPCENKKASKGTGEEETELPGSAENYCYLACHVHKLTKPRSQLATLDRKQWDQGTCTLVFPTRYHVLTSLLFLGGVWSCRCDHPLHHCPGSQPVWTDSPQTAETSYRNSSNNNNNNQHAHNADKSERLRIAA